MYGCDCVCRDDEDKLVGENPYSWNYLAFRNKIDVAASVTNVIVYFTYNHSVLH